jgi:hypothetical protein
MPRPKGSKKDKKLILTSSSSRTSISSSLPSSQSTINYSNEFINDDMKTSINKGGRPKKTEFINGNDDNITNSPTNSSSEGRVVVNPAVLRYLEQNRTPNKTNELFDKNISMDIKDENNLFDDLLKSFAVEESIIKTDPLVLKSSSILSTERRISIDELIELDKLIQDDLFWDFCTCSTDFLTSARLAEWILTHQQSAKFETSLTVNNNSF